MKKQMKTGAKAGAYSAVLTVIVVAAAVVINLIVGALPSKYTKLDTSANSIFTFDEKTEAFVAALENDVTVYHICQSGNEDTNLVEILDRYSDMNSHITVETVDPVKNPTFVSKYTEDSLSNNSLIVESAARSKVVPYSEIYYIYCADLGGKVDYSTFEYYYQMYYQYYGTALDFSEVFAGENAVVSGIDYVTTDNIPKLYTLSGHNEYALNSTITDWLETQNYQIETLELSESSIGLDGSTSETVGDIPDDAEAVLITGLEEDITEGELAALTEYVAGGGDLIVMTDYMSAELENMRKLAAVYGIDASSSLLLEGDVSSYSQVPYVVIAKTANHEIVSGISDVIMPLSHGLKIAETMPEGMTATELLSTSDAAYAKPLGFNPSAKDTVLDKVDGDIEGPFSLGVLVECEYAGSVVWLSSDYYMVNTGTGGASSVYTSAISYLCQKTETISVHTIELGTSVLNVSEGSALMWGIIAIGIIPLAFIGIGFVVWLRRRSK